jgi:hypothetical protein
VRRAFLLLLALSVLAMPAWADSDVLPDPGLTPGAVRTTNIGEVCGASTRELRHWSRERDDRIMAEYGLPGGAHPQYEVDHLIPLCLGGADDDRNLWPQERRSLEPIYNAEAKDRLEAKMCAMACAGALDIPTAQRSIAEDWTAVYSRFFRQPGESFSPAAGATTPR